MGIELWNVVVVSCYVGLVGLDWCDVELIERTVYDNCHYY